jgi:hypothetical protein
MLAHGFKGLPVVRQKMIVAGACGRGYSPHDRQETERETGRGQEQDKDTPQ